MIHCGDPSRSNNGIIYVQKVTPCALRRVNGTATSVAQREKVSGNVRSFDKYSIVLENNTQAQLIFKHSVSALLVCCKNKHCTERCLPASQVSKAG